MRILTAGESHGQANIAIVEGFPKGVKIDESLINSELKRRMSGVGRGSRMRLESDAVRILSGLRNNITLGSPVAFFIQNKDIRIFADKYDGQPALNVPRPAHADLAAALKYAETDIRNILERASARETVARVAAGALCKQFLSSFGIKIASFTVSLGGVESQLKPKDVSQIISQAYSSSLNCIDKTKEKLMLKEIEKAVKDLDTLGGVVEIWIEGLCAGIGTFMQYDKRLDAKLALALMSIPAVKGVEVGLGFEYAKRRGSKSHDAIYYSAQKGFYRKTNNSGGIEGGISNGEPVVLRAAMKPIATLKKPLDSVNLCNRKKEKAVVERSDTCAIAALGVIAENMAAIAITELFLEKFGSDTLREIETNYKNYIKTIS